MLSSLLQVASKRVVAAKADKFAGKVTKRGKAVEGQQVRNAVLAVQLLTLALPYQCTKSIRGEGWVKTAEESVQSDSALALDVLFMDA